MSLPYTRSEVKERARSHWKGACNVTLPSFTPDLRSLNAAGIAHDIRLCAKWGFWGTLIASESGTTVDEYIRFMEIAADTAPNGFHLVTHLSFSTFDESVAVAKAAEELGFEGALLSYDPCFVPRGADDVVKYTTAMAAETDLALILFAVLTWGFRSIDPRGFPLEALDQMADLDTAACIKFEAGGPATMAALGEVVERCGSRVVVQNPMEQYCPALVDWFGQQFMATSAYDSFGDRVPQWFALLNEGRRREAMDLFWSYQNLREAKSAFHHTFAGANLIHRTGWKYLGWLHGMNGGLLRMPQMRLVPGQMRSLRQAAVASGYSLPEDDAGFYGGRVQS
jgi:4-hydroxy-tetrahydrodipicolinate synthase